jgi:hypothetical protein
LRIAYIISAYKLPTLLVRLVRRLDGPEASFLIHVDAKTPETVYREMSEPLADRPNVHFLPRHRCYWGDFGHVRATLKGLRALIAGGRQFDYVVLLTGQDYPIKSNAEIAATLDAADARVFMHCFPLPNALWTDGGTDRIEHWHFRVGQRLVAFPGMPFRRPALNAAWSRIGRALHLHRRFPPGLRPYGGSSYWCMPADCARYVDAFARENERVVKFFEHVHVPDEIFFNTIVMNSPFRDRVAGDELRYTDWRAGGDNPAILTSRDLEALVQSRSLFARKFDPTVDAVVLDRLDAVLDRG